MDPARDLLPRDNLRTDLVPHHGHWTVKHRNQVNTINYKSQRTKNKIEKS